MESIRNEEKCGLRLKGEIFMKLGNNLTREDTVNNPDRHIKNTIVDIASNLIASWAFMSNTGDPHPVTWGIKTLAVGTGNPLWDPLNPPAESSTQTTLVTEFYRKTFDNVTYVNPITFLPQTDRSNIIDFSTTFLAAEAVAPLVEMGLFGGNYSANNGSGSNATVAGGGTMVNAKNFPVISKPATATLQILWRLTF